MELTAILLAPIRPDAAAVLLGSAASLRGLLSEEGGVLTERLEACRQEILTRLGEANTAEHERKGRTMHLAQVLTFARAELHAMT